MMYLGSGTGQGREPRILLLNLYRNFVRFQHIKQVDNKKYSIFRENFII
jgi:hypothetical protein